MSKSTPKTVYPQIKICGLTDAANAGHASQAGADFIGLVFVPSSPRFVRFDTARNVMSCGALSGQDKPKIVGLFVNPTDEDLQRAMDLEILDMIQLHGDEPPARVQDVKRLTDLPIIKALPIAEESDLDNIPAYEAIADWLLFDTKPAPNEGHGGTGRSFDWHILANRTFTVPWMLAGGLNADNVVEALNILSPDAVDVSSGVESSRGVKDHTKIDAFIHAVRTRQA